MGHKSILILDGHWNKRECLWYNRRTEKPYIARENSKKKPCPHVIYKCIYIEHIKKSVLTNTETVEQL